MALIGNEVASTPKNYTQVYKATHIGENRLPYMYRSFISFSYGGKHIEDFNLIATYSDRIERNGYADFEDITSSYDVLNGQFFWGSHYTTNSLQFTLSTDEIEQKTLDEFMRWFTPGKYKELILAEHPNRAIMARVSKVPEIKLLGFEKKVQFQVGTDQNNQPIVYNTSTTAYRGDIILELVMDDPHWYSKINIFGHYDSVENIYYDTWTDANGLEGNWYSKIDAVKIAYEDGIPGNNMIENSMLFGNNIYANTSTVDEAKIASVTIEVDSENNEATMTWTSGAVIAATNNLNQIVNPAVAPADGNYIPTLDDGSEYNSNYTYTFIIPNSARGGMIAGASIKPSEGIPYLGKYNEDNSETKGYFYYCGTAPTRVCLEFKMYPQFTNVRRNGHDIKFITTPGNSYAVNDNEEQGNILNTFTFFTGEDRDENYRWLKFTTPNIYTSYNKAIQIFAESDNNENSSWIELRSKIVERVPHLAVRAWAQKIIDKYVITLAGNNEAAPSQEYLGSIINVLMPKLFLDENNDPYIGEYKFDGITGEMTAIIPYNTIEEDLENPVDPTAQDLFAGTIITKVSKREDIGDMVKDNTLLIDERNQLTPEGKVIQWSTSMPYSSYVVFHDVEGGLYDVAIKYKNMYL